MLGGLVGLICLTQVVMNHTLGFGHHVFRIVVIDYLIFFFGWLSAYITAKRWRTQGGLMEELTMTNLRPGPVGHLLFANTFPHWFVILIAVFLVEAVAIIFLGPANRYMLTSLAVVFWAPVYAFVIAWFHFESIKIAYWMFAVVSLPIRDLGNRAILNLFIIPFYVLTLTGIGSIITVICMLVAMAMGEIFFQTTDLFNDNQFWEYMGVSVGSALGMSIIIFLKRPISFMYEQSFWRTYLMYTWYGAAEINHPRVYPSTLIRSVNKWGRYLKQEERETRANREDLN